MKVRIREAVVDDMPEVAEICCLTGYMGESIEGRFSDRVLFAELFVLYYLRNPEEIALVAECGGRVVGYCVGTADGVVQQRRFQENQLPLIKKRMLMKTIWRYPRDFLKVLRWSRLKGDDQAKIDDQKFPAHLHMNVHPDFQRPGIGKQLLSRFCKASAERGAGGIHIKTSTRNQSAIGFYLRNGFRESHRKPARQP